MKKIYLFLTFAVLFSLVSAASFAQSTAKLNITLSDVVSITVTQPATLDVNFDSKEKYSDGIKAVAENHIEVISSRGYVVKAIAGDITGSSGLTAGSVKISAGVGSANAGNATGITYATDKVLPAKGSSAADIVTATQTSWSGSTSATKFNITYSIGEAGAYAGKPTGLNTIPVIYTVTQP